MPLERYSLSYETIYVKLKVYTLNCLFWIMSKESKNKNEVINFIFDNDICLYFVLKDWECYYGNTSLQRKKQRKIYTMWFSKKKKNSFSTITSE